MVGVLLGVWLGLDVVGDKEGVELGEADGCDVVGDEVG